MRELTVNELPCISGGDWSVELHGGVIDVTISGDEDVQDMAAAVSTVASGAYWGARDAMADFYEWAARGWEFSARCGM